MYPLIMNKVFNQPWLIDAQTHQSIQQVLINRLQGGESQLFAGDTKQEEPTPYYMAGDTAVINMFGVVGKYLSSMEQMCGGLSLDSSLSLIGHAVDNTSVKNIMLNFDSPGGTSTGVFEAGKMISDWCQSKDIYAFTETKCCSAAYWLASKCTGIISTPSACIGSIGVYMAMFDTTAQMEKQGVKMHLFEAGLHKAIGLRPPSSEEIVMLQNHVEELHEQFKAEVNEKRSISADVMEGLTYTGAESIENGLSDSLVYSIHEALEIINS